MPDRKPNRRSSIDLGQDGWWHGWVTIGIKDDGSPDRRHRMGRTEAEVTRKVRDLERGRDIGHCNQQTAKITRLRNNSSSDGCAARDSNPEPAD